MKTPDMSGFPLPLVLGLLAVGGAGLYIMSKGGISGAAQALGAGAVTAAGAVATGAVDAAGQAVGLNPLGDMVTDPGQARWVIDQYGYLEASKWCGVPALVKGWAMDAGTGTPPPAGSAVLKAHAAVATTPAVLPSAPAPLPIGTTFEQASSAGYDWSNFGMWGPAP